MATKPIQADDPRPTPIASYPAEEALEEERSYIEKVITY
jgi:hypothetical protein